MPREPETYVAKDLFETGIGEVIVCRFKGDGRVEVGFFLLDVFCLGVKDALYHVFASEAEFREELLSPRLDDTPRAGSWGRKLVEDAIRYAQTFGVSPHPDYKKGARVFGGIDPADCRETFAFGRDGRPVLVQTPEDDPEKLDRILTVLETRLGEDGFGFIGLGGSDFDEFNDFDDSGTIIAVDSHAGEDEEPLPELESFAEDFLERHGDLFDDVAYGGAVENSVAIAFLNSAREMQKHVTESEGADSFKLKDALHYMQMVWNLANMSEEERAVALENVPEEMKPALESEADSMPQGEAPFMVLELRLLHGDNPGNERLLMLLEPL